MKRPTFLAKRIQLMDHPAVETFERVLNNGVVVDYSGNRREALHDISVAGVDVVGADYDSSSYPIRRALFQSLRESPLDDRAYEGWLTAREPDRAHPRRDRSPR
jgi:hypothetical protein